MSLDLSNLTLLRYAHIHRERSSGGMEQYLRQLNSGLLNRHNLTIIQTHVVSRSRPHEIEVETFGRGRLIWVPIRHYHQEWSARSFQQGLKLIYEYSRTGVDGKFRPKSRLSFCADVIEHLRHADILLSDAIVDMFARFEINIVLLHWLSYDVGRVIASAQRRQIPYGIINHFDNRRLEAIHLRPWLRGAAGIGGVSSRHIPSSIQRHFVNLSDAVDVEYFAPQLARPIHHPGQFLIFLPGRIAEGKGHEDLLAAVRTVSAECSGVAVAFAGLVERGAEVLAARLKSETPAGDPSQHTLWLGQLTSSELRDWYGASDVVVLPSHQEGLGRVLLEAQAMMKPVIGCNTGGIPDALVHERTGLLVPPGDRRVLAERIKSLLQDPIGRRRMGEEGRRFVSEHYSIQSLISRHEQFCLDVLRTRDGTAGASSLS
jgi:glycosyltransferase involved in cell wall biosynthesis